MDLGSHSRVLLCKFMTGYLTNTKHNQFYGCFYCSKCKQEHQNGWYQPHGPNVGLHCPHGDAACVTTTALDPSTSRPAGRCTNPHSGAGYVNSEARNFAREPIGPHGFVRDVRGTAQGDAFDERMECCENPNRGAAMCVLKADVQRAWDGIVASIASPDPPADERIYGAGVGGNPMPRWYSKHTGATAAGFAKDATAWASRHCPDAAPGPAIRNAAEDNLQHETHAPTCKETGTCADYGTYILRRNQDCRQCQVARQSADWKTYPFDATGSCGLCRDAHWLGVRHCSDLSHAEAAGRFAEHRLWFTYAATARSQLHVLAANEKAVKHKLDAMKDHAQHANLQTKSEPLLAAYKEAKDHLANIVSCTRKSDCAYTDTPAAKDHRLDLLHKPAVILQRTFLD